MTTTGMLSRITSGKVAKPHRLLVYGIDGVGKSSFAAGAPEVLFLGAEEGTNHLDVNRLGVDTLEGLRSALRELANGEHNYKSLAVDTLDWLEKLVYAEVIANHDKKIASIEDIPYGKGRVKALETWVELLPLFTACWNKGMNIILLAHSWVKKFEDPSTPQGYERYQLKLQSGASTDVAALLREYVDTVMFANFEVAVSQNDTRRAFGEGERKLYTERRPAFDAKNRLGLPFELPLSWAAYAKAAAKGQATAEASPVGEVITAEALLALAEQVSDAGLRGKVEKAIADATTPAAMASVKARILTVLNKGKA